MEQKTVRSPFVIVGEDFACGLLAHFLRSQKEQGHWVRKNAVVMEDALFGSEELMRGEASMKLLDQLFPEFQLKGGSERNSFWKDQNFHPFFGRVKPPSELTFEENFFVQSRLSFPWKQFLGSDPFTTPIEQKTVIEGEVTSIRRGEQESGEWEIRLHRGLTLKTPLLIFGRSLDQFCSLLPSEEREQFGDVPLIPKKGLALVVNFSSKIKITEREETLFLSQCISQERGYFIGRFSSFCEEKQAQYFSFSCFLNEDEADPETISRKIRLLKRTLKRIFPQFKSSSHEKIWVGDRLYPYYMVDQQFDSLLAKNKNLIFLGMTAPLHREFCDSVEFASELREKIDPVTRSLASFRQAILDIDKLSPAPNH